ncbi:hypothetical protein LA635_p1037 (plasmid) [Erwinia amylovora LA635]|uniref:Uncharacterized protein n=1 Tax=Erwinia amylovora TaxID=552 RepID=A0A0P0ZGI0_ERWAM|nr:hypothetical protein LA635_p1037 [Erwinia amylovora LA635]CDK23814.1 hypothetical protein LA636_p1036 [Erwinia amylovora LA636]CDK23864.1 hypothetical protein LA637_p1037 [Erwinia amylovora LA637]CDM08162.1 hypothetical protein EAMY692_p20036 [Erwinia amylovora]
MQLGRNDCQTVTVFLPFSSPVILVTVLRRIPGSTGFNGCHYRIAVLTPGPCNCRYGFFRLLCAGREYGRAILCADIISLAIELCWVVGGKTDIQQIAKANLFRIKTNADGFGMPCVTITHLFVGWVFGVATNIATLNRLHAINLFKYGFSTPEAASGNHRVFCRHFLLLQRESEFIRC